MPKPASKPRPYVSYEPQSPRQSEFLDHIRTKVVTFGVGSAGTGKTYLAIAAGLDALLNESVSRLIITRPTISSGPDIGYLPGTEAEKMAPYLVPIYDAIYHLIPPSLAGQLQDRGQIEVASISYVRGRNFDDAFVVVDECENLDRRSFYLLLTRICDGSKMVFCGDSLQTDLRGNESGLEDAVMKFRDHPDFGVVRFTPEDCRRSRIVRDVIRAYYPD